MKHLVEAHRILAELIKVARIVPKTHRCGAKYFLCKLGNLIQIVHADFAKGLPERFGPDVRAMSELFSLHLRVVQRQITGNVIAFFQIRSRIGFDHLAMHNLVATVVLVLYYRVRLLW